MLARDEDGGAGGSGLRGSGSSAALSRSGSLAEVGELSTTQIQQLWLARLVESCEEGELESESDDEGGAGAPSEGGPMLPASRVARGKGRRRSLSKVSRTSLSKVRRWLSRRWPGEAPPSFPYYPVVDDTDVSSRPAPHGASSRADEHGDA